MKTFPNLLKAFPKLCFDRQHTLMALRTIIMASCSDRSVSSINCSAPPLRIMVHVLALGQPLKKLYLEKCISTRLVCTFRFFFDILSFSSIAKALTFFLMVIYTSEMVTTCSCPLDESSAQHRVRMNKLYLSPPTCTSSKSSQRPSTSSVREPTLV